MDQSKLIEKIRAELPRKNGDKYICPLPDYVLPLSKSINYTVLFRKVSIIKLKSCLSVSTVDLVSGNFAIVEKAGSCFAIETIRSFMQRIAA